MKRRTIMLAAPAIVAATAVSAQSAYPNRPVRIIVPFPAGGPVDAVARQLAQKLTESLGQNFIVDNRAGANSVIGSDAVAKAAPDGYTLLVNASLFSINQHLLKTPYDIERDFAPIALLANGAMVVSVAPTLEARNFEELVTLSKANPGKFNFAIGSVGAAGHIATELLMRRAGVQWFVVAYKGSAPAYQDLMGSQIQGFIDPALGSLPHVRSGKIRGIAVTSAKRIAALPDLPTVAESGVPGFEFYSWYGLWAPAGTPPEIVARLNAEANRGLGTGELKDRLLSQGFEPQMRSPQEFAAFLREDKQVIGQIVRDANIRVE
jgi:tripartite-type tricarboxylate transporter receptor subunit TctC